MKKNIVLILFFGIIAKCNAQCINGIWQYGDSIYANGISNYEFVEINNGYYFTYSLSKYDEMSNIRKIEGICIYNKDSIQFYVHSVTVKSYSEWLLTRRNKNDSIPYYDKELYFDTVTHSMNKRNWKSSTNYWKLKNCGKIYSVKYNPPLCFNALCRYYKEGTFEVLEIDGDKYYATDPSPKDYGEQIDNREQ